MLNIQDGSWIGFGTKCKSQSYAKIMFIFQRNCNNNNHAAPWVMSAVEVALQRPDLSWLMPQTTKLCIDFAVGCPWIFYAWWCNRPMERSYTGTQAVTHDTHIIQLCYLPNYYILFPSPQAMWCSTLEIIKLKQLATDILYMWIFCRNCINISCLMTQKHSFRLMD